MVVKRLRHKYANHLYDIQYDDEIRYTFIAFTSVTKTLYYVYNIHSYEMESNRITFLYGIHKSRRIIDTAQRSSPQHIAKYILHIVMKNDSLQIKHSVDLQRDFTNKNARLAEPTPHELWFRFQFMTG